MNNKKRRNDFSDDRFSYFAENEENSDETSSKNFRLSVVMNIYKKCGMLPYLLELEQKNKINL